MKKIRWNLLIYPRFQISLLLLNLVNTLAQLLVVAFLFFQSMNKLSSMGKAAQLPEGHAYFQFLSLHETTILKYLLCAGIIGGIFSTIFNLILTHKISGPIIRLKSHLKEIAEGKKVESLKFRKGDFFTDLPKLVNDAFPDEKKEHQ